jgi:hypothetical protein
VCLRHCVRTQETACGQDYWNSFHCRSRNFSFRHNCHTDTGNNGASCAMSTEGFCPWILRSKHEALPPRPYVSKVTFVVVNSGLLFCGTPGELAAWLAGSLLRLYNPTFSQATCSACCLFHVGFVLGLLVNPEDGVGMFLRSSGWLLTYYMAMGWTARVQFTAGAKTCFSSPQRPDWLWGPAGLFYNGYQRLFPRG